MKAQLKETLTDIKASLTAGAAGPITDSVMISAEHAEAQKVLCVQNRGKPKDRLYVHSHQEVSEQQNTNYQQSLSYIKSGLRHFWLTMKESEFVLNKLLFSLYIKKLLKPNEKIWFENSH